MAAELETLRDRLQALPEGNFTFKLFSDNPTKFLTEEEYENLRMMGVAYRWYDAPSGFTGCSEAGLTDPKPEWSMILEIKFFRPYTPEREQHYREFTRILKTQNNKRVFDFTSISRGTPVIQDEKYHMRIVRPAWYEEIKAVLERHGQDIDKLQYSYSDPLLGKMTTIVDQPAVYGPDSVMVSIEIPGKLGPNCLYLTEEKINWLVEQLSV